MLNAQTFRSGTGKIVRNHQGRTKLLSAVAMAALGSGGLLTERAKANNDTWIGTTANFGTVGNWSGTASGLPATNDSLEFNSATGFITSTVDNLFTPATYNISGITFDAGAPAYTISPNTAGTNGFTLTGGIVNNSVNLQTINDLITFTGTTDTIGGSGNIALGGAIAGATAATLTFSNSGTTTLNALNTFTGGMAISAGIVNANVSNAALSNTVSTPNSGALGATDSVHTVTVGGTGTLSFGQSNVLGGNANTQIQTTIVLNPGGTLTNSNSTFSTVGAITLNGGTWTSTGGNVNLGTGIPLEAWYIRGTNNTSIITVGGTSPSTMTGTGAFGLSSTPTTFNVSKTGGTGADLTVSGSFDNSATNSGGSGMNKNGSGTMLLSGSNFYSGPTIVSGGTLSVSGTLGSVDAAGQLTVGNLASTAATFNILPGSNLRFNAVNALVGNVATAPGVIYQTGGTVTGINELQLGDVTGGAYGYFNMSGSASSTTMAELDDGGFNGAGVGVVDITAGSLTTTNYITMARGVAGIGILNVLGGTVNQTQTAAANQFALNWGGAATSIINIGGSGSLLAAGQNVNLMQTGATGALGEINLLPGGTLQALSVFSGSATGTTLVNFDGGTLKAGAANTSFLTGTNLTGAEIYSGGGTINNNSVNITIGASLVNAAGSGVTLNTITPSAGGTGYVGAPAVIFSNGGGTGAAGYAVVSNGIVTGVVVTNPGYNYTSAPSISFVGGGGTGAAATPTTTANTAGTINFSGSGITTLAGTSTYTGATSILAGSTLKVTGSLGNTVVSVQSGGFLTGVGNGTTTGLITGNINVNPGGAIDFTKDGLTGETVLTGGGGLTLGNASSPATLSFNFNSSSSDLINLGSTALNDVGGATINLNAFNIATGTTTYTLISYGSQTGLTTASGGGFTVGTHPVGLYTFALQDTSTALTLTVSATAIPATVYWTGKFDTVWNDANTAGPVTNFSSTADGNTDAGQLPGAATDVVFTAASNGNGSSLSGAAISTTLGANFAINSLTVNSTAASVAINGSNSLTLNAAASTGSLGYSAGTGLVVQNGAGPVTIGVTSLIPATSQSWSNNGSNPLTISSAVPGTATAGNVTTLSFTGSGSGNTTLSGVVGNGASGGTLALAVAQTGNGLLILSGSNTFTGGVAISSGTLQLGNAGALNAAAPNAVVLNGGTLDLNSFNLSVSSLMGGTSPTNGGVITDTSSIAGTTVLTNAATTTQTFYGNILNGANGRVLAFNQSGSGVTALGGSSTYTGGTQFTGGTLEALSNNAFGIGTVNLSGGAIALKIANGVTLANKIVINAAAPGTGAGALTTVTSADSATFSGEIDYNFALTSGGLIVGPSSGLLSFTGPIIVGGTTPPTQLNLRAGNIQLADATGLSNYGAATLLVSTTGASLGHNNGIASGAMVQLGNSAPGTLDLNGYDQTVGGIQQVTNAAIITYTQTAQNGNNNPDGPSGTSILTVNTSGTAFPDSAPDSYAGSINSYVELVKTGAGTLALTNASTTANNSYFGGTNISQGVLAVAVLDGSSSGASNLGISYNGAQDLLFSSPGGTLRYTGATSSTSRSFTINDGVTATLDVSTAGAILTDSGNATVDGTESASPASFAKGPGAGTLILTGNYPYHGNTTVNGGALLVNGTTGTTGLGVINIVAGGTLSGTGTVNGSLNHSAGTIVGGASATVPTSGSLTFTGPLLLNGGTDLNNINAASLSSGGVNQQGYINATGGLAFGSTGENVSLQFTGTLGTGTYVYNLFDYSGSYTGTPNLTYTSNAGRVNYTTDLSTPGEINVDITSGGVANLFWNSTSSTAWDTTTGNWYNAGSNVPNTTFVQGDNVTFADSGTAVGSGTLGSPLQGNITINTTVNPGAVNVTSNTTNYNFSGTGSIAGSGVLTLSGASTLTIGTSNTYTGGTNINGGILALANAGALGPSGTISFGGGTLQYSASNTVDYSARFNTSNNQPIVIDTNGQAVTFASNLTSSNGTLTKLGAGTLTLSATGSSFNGGTNISNGTISTAGTIGGGSSPVLVGTNGTLLFGNGTDTNNISGAGNVTNTGVETITGDNSAFSGTWTSGNQYSFNSAANGSGGVPSTSATAAYVNNFGYNTNGMIFGTAGTYYLGSLTGVAGSEARGASGANVAVTLSIGNLNTSTVFSGTIQNNASTTSTSTVALIKTGTGSLTLGSADGYTAGTNVSAGTLIFAAPAALPNFTSLTVGATANVMAANHSTGVTGAAKNNLFASSLSIAGATNAWTAKVDLGNNDLIVQNGSLSTITNQVKTGYGSGNFQGKGIVSSAAAGDTTHLTTLGVILNTADGTPSGALLYGSGTTLGAFDGATASATTDVLVKYTYYGDANLDGKVDGTDYSRIDAAYLADQSSPGSVTGWYNGDFNYDGVINGSDYTLIDNAFNTQGAVISDQIATATAEIAPSGVSAVPEPTTLGLLGIGAFGLLGRRNRRRR